MTPGTHGSTFGGNPLAMSVGNAVLDNLFKKDFLKNVRQNGEYFSKHLKSLKNKYPNVISEVRGLGLLLGIKLKVNNVNFIDKLLEKNLLTVKASENVVRLLPPLNVKKNEINKALEIIEKVCKTYK